MENKFKKHDIVNHVTNYQFRLLVTEVKETYSAGTTYVCRWLNKIGLLQEVEFEEFELVLSDW